MEEPDRPPLGAEVYEQIEDSQYSVQKIYATRLNLFAEDLRDSSSIAGKFGGGEGLRPPKRPIAIGKCLGAYAIALFDIESAFYPRNDGLHAWLEALARRVEQKIIAHVLNIGDSPMRAFFLVRLTYHASEQQMRESIRAALKERVSGNLPEPAKSQRPITRPASTTASRQAMKPEQNRNESPPKKTRMSVTISSPTGAKRMEAFLSAKGIGQTEFATKLGITDRTLRAFRSTGRIKRETFDKIAAQMDTTREKLMDPNG